MAASGSFAQSYRDIKGRLREELARHRKENGWPILDEDSARLPFTPPRLPPPLEEALVGSRPPSGMTRHERRGELGVLLLALSEFPGVYGDMRGFERVAQLLGRSVSPAEVTSPEEHPRLLEELA